MQIESVRIEGQELILTTTGRDARLWVFGFKPGDYEIVARKPKRSLDANSMMWAVCEKIAKAVGLKSEDVYKQAVQDYGEYTPLPIRADAVDEFGRIWGAKGLGWFVVVVDDSKLPGYKLVRAYNGSSTYNTKQMSRLIDGLLQEANNLGIETMDEAERRSLLDAWAPR